MRRDPAQKGQNSMSNQVVPISEGSAAIAETGAHAAPEKPTAKQSSRRQKDAAQSQKHDKAAKASRSAKRKGQTKTKTGRLAARQGTAKAKVITMRGRKGGVSLEEICKATGWQAHTVRGFISLLGTKGGYAISSSRNEDGARIYSLQK